MRTKMFIEIAVFSLMELCQTVTIMWEMLEGIYLPEQS